MSSGSVNNSSSSKRSSGHTTTFRAQSSMSHGAIVPQTCLDASIPFNLPPRRSMKMLKDGSDFVWPDSAHTLFVKGLQAWKVQTMGSKRTRAPRGEGKTDFLVQYLENHGVERTKKQVASHLQVLRTEWRNLDNPVLLNLVDESHTRSFSEPSLPSPSISSETGAYSPSVFEGSPDPNEEETAMDDLLQPGHFSSNQYPASAPPFYNPGHDIYLGRPQPPQTATSRVPLRVQSTPDISWQLDSFSWNGFPSHSAAQQAGTSHQSHTQYSPDTSFHTSSRPMPPPSYQDSRFHADYLNAFSFSQQHPEVRERPTSFSPPRPQPPGSLAYPFYSNSQQSASSNYGTGSTPYHPHYTQRGSLPPGSSANVMGSGGTASNDVVESQILPSAQPASQSQWSPLNTSFPPRRPSHPH